MKLPDGRSLELDEAVLAEATLGDDRVVLWITGDQVDERSRWERVVAVGGPSAAIDGIRFVGATLTPMRKRTGSGFVEKLRGLVRSKAEPTWKRPGGGIYERSGARRTGLVLAWAEDETDAIDETRVRRRWQNVKSVRRLGPNLVLVEGVEPETLKPERTISDELAPALSARQLAAQALSEARQAEDRRREVTALIDLAVSYLNQLDASPAVPLLEDALESARRLEDRPRELDALVNLAQAAILLGHFQQAVDWLRPALAYARELGDRYAEKNALERLGHAYQNGGDYARALDQFEQALALARQVGDAQHLAMLLWHAGISLAELGRSDRALARGEEAVAVFRRLRKPQAEEYARHLAAYRTQHNAPTPALSIGGKFDASVITTTTQPQTASPPGPGLLRMALTAAQAVATFTGSGFKTVSRDQYSTRLAVCSQCDMFSGVRCRACGCISAAKARLPHEHCPAGKWPA